MTTRKKTGDATGEVVKPVESQEQPATLEKAENAKVEVAAGEVKKVEDQKIYVGPTVPKTNLFQYTLLSNGIPEDAKKHVEACPTIKKLIVPYTELAQARVALDKIGTPENTFFEKIVDYLKGSER